MARGTGDDDPTRPPAAPGPQADTDFRRHPERYKIGRGEEGVFHVEPYKSELLPLWRFRTPEIAQASADAIYAKYRDYRDAGDFVGMDMARKYLQMGYTRSRRYANHKGGRKYAADGTTVLPPDPDPVKVASAAVFRARLDQVRADPEYQRRKAEHLGRVESG